MGAFIVRSRTSRSPILDFALFKNDVFRTGNMATFFFGASFMSITIFLPLYLVNVMGVSATRAGAALIPFSMGLVFSATMAGQLVARIGYRRQIFGGSTLLFVAMIALATMDVDVSYLRVTLFMVLAGVGVGPAMPLFTLAVQNAVDVRFIGQATSASQFFRQTGATVGAALMGTLLATTLGAAFAAIELPPGVGESSPASAEGSVSSGGAELLEQIRRAYEQQAAIAATPAEASALRDEGARVAEETSWAVRAAFADANRRIYWLSAFLVLLAGAFTLRMPELPLRTTHDRLEASKSQEDSKIVAS
jgi:MFS family permease